MPLCYFIKLYKIELYKLHVFITCLLTVACLVFFSVPMSCSIAFGLFEGMTSDNAIASGLWAESTFVMNCSFNSLILFWKSKVLHSEGAKIIRKIKDRVLGS